MAANTMRITNMARMIFGVTYLEGEVEEPAKEALRFHGLLLIWYRGRRGNLASGRRASGHSGCGLRRLERNLGGGFHRSADPAQGRRSLFSGRLTSVGATGHRTRASPPRGRSTIASPTTNDYDQRRPRRSQEEGGAATAEGDRSPPIPGTHRAAGPGQPRPRRARPRRPGQPLRASAAGREDAPRSVRSPPRSR